MSNSDDDWLYSEGEEEEKRGFSAAPGVASSRSGAYMDEDDDLFGDAAGPSSPSSRRQLKAGDMEMGRRDWLKIDAQFQDSGYREGITAGKQARLQGGFDAGFKDVGAPIGRRIGSMRGETAAMLAWLTQRSQALTGTGASRSLGRGAGLARTAAPMGKGPANEAVKEELERAVRETRALISDLARVKLEDVGPIDYEALQHDKEHEEEGRGGRVAESRGDITDEDEERRRDEEQRRREAMLEDLERRVREARESLARAVAV